MNAAALKCPRCKAPRLMGEPYCPVNCGWRTPEGGPSATETAQNVAPVVPEAGNAPEATQGDLVEAAAKAMHAAGARVYMSGGESRIELTEEHLKAGIDAVAAQYRAELDRLRGDVRGAQQRADEAQSDLESLVRGTATMIVNYKAARDERDRLREEAEVVTMNLRVARRRADRLAIDEAKRARELAAERAAHQATRDEVKRLRADRDGERARHLELLPLAAEAVRARYDEPDAALRAERDRAGKLAALLRDIVDPDPCSYDHHGGCQAHGYLSLEPGERCPQAEAKELLAELGTTTEEVQG